MGDGDNHIPGASAFSKARKKLKESAFVLLNEQLQQVFDQHIKDDSERTQWRGLSLKAVDGSTLRLPSTQEAIDHFGGMQPDQGKFVPMARVSFLYNVMTDVIVAGEMTHYGIGEGIHLDRFLDNHVNPNDCLILDRGYFDRLLPALIRAKGAHFIMRVGVRQWNEARDFAESGEQERLVRFKVPLWVREQWKDERIHLPEEIDSRLIRVELSTGEVEVLITDLTDGRRYPTEEFDGIYHKRWGVEEGIKNVKCKIELENWSGKTVHSVRQDFYAAIVMANLAQTLTYFKNLEVAEATKNHQHDYKVNIKRTIALLRDRLSALYSSGASKTEEILRSIGERMTKALTLVRPGRSFPRKARPKRQYAPPYKPIA